MHFAHLIGNKNGYIRHSCKKKKKRTDNRNLILRLSFPDNSRRQHCDRERFRDDITAENLFHSLVQRHDSRSSHYRVAYLQGEVIADSLNFFVNGTRLNSVRRLTTTPIIPTLQIIQCNIVMLNKDVPTETTGTESILTLLHTKECRFHRCSNFCDCISLPISTYC